MMSDFIPNPHYIFLIQSCMDTAEHLNWGSYGRKDNVKQEVNFILRTLSGAIITGSKVGKLQNCGCKSCIVYSGYDSCIGL